MYAKLTIILFLGLLLPLAVPAAAYGAGPTWSEVSAAISELTGMPPTSAALSNIKNYVEQSSAPEVQKGLSILLQPALLQKRVNARRSVSSLVIDGKAGDWEGAGLARTDELHDLVPISDTRPLGPYSAADDIARYGFIADDDYVYVMLEPAALPGSGLPYYYAVNLHNAYGRIFYIIMWTGWGGYLQERDAATDTQLRTFRTPEMSFAAREVFEARIPRALFQRLPLHFYIEPVAWNEANNAVDYKWEGVVESTNSEKYNNYALELFCRYAERQALAPDDPFPLAQATADAYIYKVVDDATRETVVDDGLLMLAQAELASEYNFPGQINLRNIEFDQLLLWANRLNTFIFNDYRWKFRASLAVNNERFSREIYDFLFLNPRTLVQARSLIDDAGILDATSLRSTVQNIEYWLSIKRQYRSPLEFMQRMYDSDPAYFQELYDAIVWEEENNANVITTVEGEPIYKYSNGSASFQLDYLEQHDTYYGNCGDTMTMALAMAKAIGLPAVHFHYDAIDDPDYIPIHSFPAYYSSSSSRYLGFLSPWNQVFPWAITGRDSERIHYYVELPIVSPDWQLRDRWFAPISWTIPGNQCSHITTLDGWEDVNVNGTRRYLPGTCGCYSTETDADGDGTADCYDECPSDSAKTRAGACGCGFPEDAVDTDGDTVVDCTDLDDDDDGVSDGQESADGSDRRDRGSVLPVLGTTVCSEWNGFLGGMWNIMEHINRGSNSVSVESTVYDAAGTPVGSTAFSILPHAQFDLLVHDLPGWTSDSYGRVCSTVLDGDAGTLDGQTIYYKPAGNGEFEFAFGMPFLPGTSGSQFVPFNTYQPSLVAAERMNFVANWIQVTNLENSAHSGRLIFYDRFGAVLDSLPLLLQPAERRDISGHQFGRDVVGTVEWRPESPGAKTQLRNVRYYYDSSNPGVNGFTSALQLNGTVGSGRLLSVPLNTEEGSAILEISDVSGAGQAVGVQIFSADGTLLHHTSVALPPYGTEHIITDNILQGRTGIAEIQGSTATIALAMHYGRTPWGGADYVYGVQAREALGQSLKGSYNTFLNQSCRLLLANPTAQTQDVNVSMTRFDGSTVLAEGSVTVPAHGLHTFDLCSHDVPDAYGVVAVEASPNAVTAEVVRAGPGNTYRFPLPLRE